MSSRFLRAALICVLGCCGYPVTVMAIDPPATQPWAGTITYCEGDATLHRGNNAFRVVRGAGIRVGDTIESGVAAKVALVLHDGPSITLADQAWIDIDRHNQQWNVNVLSGQTRVVHDGNSPLRLITSESKIEVDRAIVQLSRGNRQTQFELVTGSASFNPGTGGYQWISQPASYIVHSDRKVQQVSALQWNLSSDQIRLAAAMQTTPTLQAPPSTTPGPSGALTDPEGQLQSPSDLLVDPFLDDSEDDDELPRITQDAPPATPATRAGIDDAAPDDDSIRSNVSTFAGSGSLSLGNFFGFSGSPASGASNNDANQQTFQGDNNGSPFPGAIHLLTTEKRYDFTQVQLNTDEITGIFQGSADPKYFSIGEGTAPTTQVVTNFFTATTGVPNVIDVPQFDLHLIHLDQYTYPDPARQPAQQVGITGLTGANPTSPTIVGAAPLVDNRSPNQLNHEATFALGEFLIEATPGGGVSFAIRRSDQDRLIIKDPFGNDADDIVIPNEDVATFTDEVDPRFLPQSPTVKEPVASSFSDVGTRYPDLDIQRQAAFTTLIADQLKEFATRTNQTRFVADGKIIDISGYKPTP